MAAFCRCLHAGETRFYVVSGEVKARQQVGVESRLSCAVVLRDVDSDLPQAVIPAWRRDHPVEDLVLRQCAEGG